MFPLRIEEETAASAVPGELTPPVVYQECFNITKAASTTTQMPGNNGGHRLGRCESQTFCYNGGTCHITLLGNICECNGPYTGQRCQQFNFNFLARPISASSSDMRTVSVVFPAVVIGALALAVFLLLAYIFIKRKRDMQYDSCRCQATMSSSCPNANGAAAGTVFRQQSYVCSAHVEPPSHDQLVHTYSQTEPGEDRGAVSETRVSIANGFHAEATPETPTGNGHMALYDMSGT